MALETNQNILDNAIDFLIKLNGSESELLSTMERMTEAAGKLTSSDFNGPSTSTGVNSIMQTALAKAQKEMESLRAYERFADEMPDNEHDYLDLPLVHEEQLLAQYKRYLQE